MLEGLDRMIFASQKWREILEKSFKNQGNPGLNFLRQPVRECYQTQA